MFFQNLDHTRDLLLGNPAWKVLEHMPAPGLFQDKKQNNFFQVNNNNKYIYIVLFFKVTQSIKRV